ncbi:hypothetical protein BGZ65_007204, partial [Modicella reniformis]
TGLGRADLWADQELRDQHQNVQRSRLSGYLSSTLLAYDYHRAIEYGTTAPPLRAVPTRIAPRTITRIAPRVIISRVANYSSAAGGKLDAPGSGKDIDPKIVSIVDQISGLTLLQTADLVSLLKSRLNIQEIAMPVGGSASAAGQGSAAAAAPVEEEKVAEKTVFNVKIEKFDAAAKAKLIREIKNIIPGINLVEAKKFVESAPKVVKEGLNKADAEKLKKTLEDLGATVSLE